MHDRNGIASPLPGLRVRLLARLRGRRIDDQVLAGASPSGDPVIRARLAQLLDRGYRSRIANALRRLLEAARRHQPDLYVARIPLREREVLTSAPLIRTLADELEDEDETLSPRGVILADRLIRDGDSPVFWPCDDSVEIAVKHARAALHLG